MKEKIYPTLPDIREHPTAPDIVNVGPDDRGHSYRLKVIADTQKFFEEEIQKREAFSKKYFRWSKIINIADSVLIGFTVCAEGAGIVLSATGVGALVGLGLGIGGVITGGLSLIGNNVSKKTTTKAEKHLKILNYRVR